MFTKAYRNIAMLVLIAFTISFVLPFNQISYAMQMDQYVEESLPKVQQNALVSREVSDKKVGSMAIELDEGFKQIKSSIENKDLEALRESITRTKDIFINAKAEVDKEFARNFEELEKIDAKVAQVRLQKFRSQLEINTQQFTKAIEELESLLKQTDNIEDNEIDSISKKVDQISKQLSQEAPSAPIGKSLPHNNIQFTPKSPVLGSGISPSYERGDEKPEKNTLPKEPQAEDTAETPETIQTVEIKKLSDSLESIVEPYEYVRNSIDYEPYYGSRKGATGTLNQLSGNDYDQASLLIAILRNKGIPARYVRGVIEMPILKAMKWTGAENVEAAARILSACGVPTTSIITGGKVTHVRIEHVWTEAYVAYDDYRGTGNMSGEKVWVPLDPSFKEYEKEQGLDFANILDIDYGETLDMFENMDFIKTEIGGITRIDSSPINLKGEDNSIKLEEYLKNSNLENATWKDVFGGYKIVEKKLELLPNTLPYKTMMVSAEYASIPEEMKDKISFSIKGADAFGLNFNGNDSFSYKANSVDLYGKKITLTWVPASAEDEAVINQYGSIFKTPAYLVQLRPVLKIDGKVVASGDSVGMAYRQEFTLSFTSAASSSVDEVNNTVTAGSIYCVGLDYGNIAPQEFKAIEEKLTDLKANITEQNIYSDEAMGEMLNATIKAYFGYLDVYNNIIETKIGVRSFRQISEGITGYNVKTRYLFNSPVSVEEGGMYIDVDRDVHSTVSVESKTENEKAFMLSSGVVSSYMEHSIFEQMCNAPAVSTIKILEQANNTGVPVLSITKDNLSSMLSKLEVDQTVKEDIRNSVNAGKVVIIPQKEIGYFDWTGAGYIVLDADTGAAGYMISGRIAGGSFSVTRTLGYFVEDMIQGIIFIFAIELLKDIVATMITSAVLGAIASWAITIFLTYMLVCYVIFMVQLIEMYEVTKDITYIEQFIASLASFVTLGILSSAKYKKAKADLEYLKALERSQKELYDTARQKGVPEDCIPKIQEKFGTNNLNEAKDAIDTFGKEGVKPQDITKIAEHLDKDGIESFKNILNENSGKFGEQDNPKIIDLLEKTTDATERSQLENNIRELTNRDILPKDYQKYGIEKPIDIIEALKYLKERGLDKSDLEKLWQKGIKPSEYENKGIKDKADVDKLLGEIDPVEDEIVRSLLDEGVKPEVIELLREHGIEPTEYGDYGVDPKSSTCAQDINRLKNLMKKGFDKAAIKELLEYDYRPRDYGTKQIKTPKQASDAVKAIDVLKSMGITEKADIISILNHMFKGIMDPNSWSGKLSGHIKSLKPHEAAPIDAWLKEGYDVYRIPESTEQGVRMPDCILSKDGVMEGIYELKTEAVTKSIDNLWDNNIEKGFEQIETYRNDFPETSNLKGNIKIGSEISGYDEAFANKVKARLNIENSKGKVPSNVEITIILQDGTELIIWP